MRWRPIKTAPKDFTPVLAWDGLQCVVVAYSGRDKKWFLLEGENQAHDESPIEWPDLSHWTRLPSPPSETGSYPGRAPAGAKGGRVRAENLSPERRSEIARTAAEARWAKAGA